MDEGLLDEAWRLQEVAAHAKASENYSQRKLRRAKRVDTVDWSYYKLTDAELDEILPWVSPIMKPYMILTNAKQICPYHYTVWERRFPIPLECGTAPVAPGKLSMGKSQTRSGIPRVAVTMYSSDELPLPTSRAFNRLRQSNPEWDVLYFSETRARQFLSNEISHDAAEAFDALVSIKQRSELFGYAYCYAKGGAFVAPHVAPMADNMLEKLFGGSHHPFVATADESGIVNSVLFGAKQKHPAMKQAVDSAVSRITSRVFPADLTLLEEVTGDLLLGAALQSELGVRFPLLNQTDVAACEKAGLHIVPAKGNLKCGIKKIIVRNETVAHDTTTEHASCSYAMVGNRTNDDYLWLNRNLYRS